MSSPRNTEPSANWVLAAALRLRNPDWNDDTVHAERTRVIAQSTPGSGTGRRPDILIAPPRRQPVIVETEFAPAHTVDRDAAARLGTSLQGTGDDIEGVLAVVLPESLKTGDLKAVESVAFRYATHYLNARGAGVRWPAEKSWLEGGVDDLADTIEYLSLSERQLARGSDALETVVRQAAGRLEKHVGQYPRSRIAKNLHQEPGEQTERMAAAICVSAFVFHGALEGQEGIPPVPTQGHIDKGELLIAWDKILAVNYWPIFSIARDLVAELPIRVVPTVMDKIAGSLSDLAKLGATTYHDLTGRMFQTLIADRKFLATFYTLPESACLLAELAIERLDVNWSDRAAIEQLRIADFACGTGALLSAAQRAINRRHRRAGGNDRDLHRVLMERVLIGLDIMPAATHLTCSMLSSAHPSLVYGQSRIHTMPYGIQENETHIGALDLLGSDRSYSLFATGKSMAGTATATQSEHYVTVKDESCDLVIMNPPFTRPTNHEAGHGDVPVPSFAGFGTRDVEQQEMARKLRGTTGLFGSGHAGLASNFMDLGHRKLKEGGVLALVIPFSFVRGGSWQDARDALRAHYSDVHVISIAASGPTARAFSADTGMAECLVLATKGGEKASPAAYSNLTARPSSLLQAAIEAKRAVSNAVEGEILDGGAAGVGSTSVIEVVRALESGRLCLPRQTQAVPVPVVALSAVAARGLVDRDINGGPTDAAKTGPPQGPFVLRLIRQGEVPTWPMLWAHAADRERTLIVHPDSCGDPRPDDRDRAAARWRKAASRLHVSRDFRLNSQSLAMCITPEKCLGGTAWPNVIPHDDRHAIPLLLWCNSTLGLILFWWKGTRQQAGRARLTITRIPGLPVLDPRTLTSDQVDRCNEIFEGLKDRSFLPANEAYRDETRKALDRDLLFGDQSVLRLLPESEESLDLLRKQWCAEPSVHGGKKTRILQ